MGDWTNKRSVFIWRRVRGSKRGVWSIDSTVYEDVADEHLRALEKADRKARKRDPSHKGHSFSAFYGDGTPYTPKASLRLVG